MYESKHELLGPGSKHAKSIRVLNRVLAWTPEGIAYEADQRHADLVVSTLGLQEPTGESTPGTREEVERMLKDEGEPLPPHAAIEYRALAARLNYLALDRPDIQYATKEAVKHMATPRGNQLP